MIQLNRIVLGDATSSIKYAPHLAALLRPYFQNQCRTEPHCCGWGMRWMENGRIFTSNHINKGSMMNLGYLSKYLISSWLVHFNQTNYVILMFNRQTVKRMQTDWNHFMSCGVFGADLTQATNPYAIIHD